MSLLEQALASMVRPGPLCTIATLKQDNPKRADEIEELVAAAGTPKLFYSIAAKTLTETFGTKIEGQVVSRHQRGACQCRS